MRYDDRITAIESDDRILFDEQESYIEEMAIEAELAFLQERDELDRSCRFYNPEPEYLNQDWIDKNNY